MIRLKRDGIVPWKGRIENMEENNIVPTNIPYNSSILQQNIEQLKARYNFLIAGNIGYSVLGKPIRFIRIGNGPNEVMYSGSIHANEWINSIVLMKFVEDYAKAYEQNGFIYGYSAREIFRQTSIYIVPMVNPDGVDLLTGAIPENTGRYHQFKYISLQFPGIPFPDGWKANFNGVDLNLQFPAGWLDARRIKFAQGYTKPAPRDFVGFGPLTEPEALALYNFTLIHNFRLILAYHTQGEVIYWKFADFEPEGSREIGERFAEASGYLLDLTPPESAFAGYKDWFIQDYNRPGYTIETGLGTNPLPISQFAQIYNENIGTLTLGAIL